MKNLKTWRLASVTTVLIITLAFFALLIPTSASTQQPTQQCVANGLISDVKSWAGEVQHGPVHVARWMKVLAAFGEDNGQTPTTLSEARNMWSRFSAARWDPVLGSMLCLNANGSCVSDELLANVQSYIDETQNGAEHVERWTRVRDTLNGQASDATVVTLDEAKRLQKVHNSSGRWDAVVDAILCMKAKAAATADPIPQPTPDPAPQADPTPDPTPEVVVVDQAPQAQQQQQQQNGAPFTVIDNPGNTSGNCNQVTASRTSGGTPVYTITVPESAGRVVCFFNSPSTAWSNSLGTGGGIHITYGNTDPNRIIIRPSVGDEPSGAIRIVFGNHNDEIYTDGNRHEVNLPAALQGQLFIQTTDDEIVGRFGGGPIANDNIAVREGEEFRGSFGLTWNTLDISVKQIPPQAPFRIEGISELEAWGAEFTWYNGTYSNGVFTPDQSMWVFDRCSIGGCVYDLGEKIFDISGTMITDPNGDVGIYAIRMHRPEGWTRVHRFTPFNIILIRAFCELPIVFNESDEWVEGKCEIPSTVKIADGIRTSHTATYEDISYSIKNGLLSYSGGIKDDNILRKRALISRDQIDGVTQSVDIFIINNDDWNYIYTSIERRGGKAYVTLETGREMFKVTDLTRTKGAPIGSITNSKYSVRAIAAGQSYVGSDPSKFYPILQTNAIGSVSGAYKTMTIEIDHAGDSNCAANPDSYIEFQGAVYNANIIHPHNNRVQFIPDRLDICK